jgi:hypothetical protein
MHARRRGADDAEYSRYPRSLEKIQLEDVYRKNEPKFDERFQ